MKLLFPMCAFLLIFVYGCGESASTDKEPSSPENEWFVRGDWLHNLKLIPHSSVNQKELFNQYHKDSVFWNKAFGFLRDINLENLLPGRYVIDSGNVIALVSEIVPQSKDSTKWEAHRNFNDLQYIVRGKAGMGIASISDPTIEITEPYNSEDNERFNIKNGRYYDAEPGEFFIFSPQEIHRPAFRLNSMDTIKKIVIKVRVP
jgi:YhcH/YjgK/YiaL family protein